MMNRIALPLLLFFSFFSHPVQVGSAAASDGVTENQITLDFPDTVTFSATISASAEITAIVLEYGNQQLTCGEVIAKAFPDFTPASRVQVEWTWDMRQSGSLPPGATLWWRWRYADGSGNEVLSEKRTATWLDERHAWQSLSSDLLNLYWYQGSQAFAQDLLTAAQGGLVFNETHSGLKPEAPIDLYIYANTDDMKDAILYEPSWTGGLAYPEFDIVILGISASDLDWGRNAIVHELTHVLVGQLTFSCLGDVPTWLNEGLAVYAEGDLDPASQLQLDEAIRENTLLSVRSLSGGFSEVTSKALLSYSQSYSLVKYLVERYRQEKMTALLVRLRDGSTINESLQSIYGFDVDGLEDRWREAIGAQPRSVTAQATTQPTATHVPTIVPVHGPGLSTTPTPFTIPTSTGDKPTGDASASPVLPLSYLLCCFSLIGLVIIGAIAFGFLADRRTRMGGKNQ